MKASLLSCKYLDKLVIGCDQIMECNGQILSKANNPNDLSEYIVVRNVKNTTNSKLQISKNLASLLQVNTRIYIEYLKDESLRLRKVEDSKEQSKVKMDDTEISFENLEDEQTELSSSLDMEKIKEIETLSKNYEGLKRLW